MADIIRTNRLGLLRLCPSSWRAKYTLRNLVPSSQPACLDLPILTSSEAVEYILPGKNLYSC